MEKEEQQPASVDEWVESLSKEKMPALAQTVHKLGKLTTDEDSRVSQLSEQILKDPNLTSKVLQVANSVVYRGVAGNVPTVTRAIVLMGFTTIRDISLSMKVLDEMLKKSPSQHLKNVLAKSFHAAMQAKGMMEDAKYSVKEEIFIAGLLLHLGEMSVLSRNDKWSHQLDHMITGEGMTPDAAAKKLLGFTFDELTLAIANQWNLSRVMVDALREIENPPDEVAAVMLGEELSQVAGLGWDSDSVKNVIKKIAEFTSSKPSEVLEQAKKIADYAKDVASMYGADSVKHLIPPSNYTEEVAKSLNVITLEETPEELADQGAAVQAPPEPRKFVELDITPEMIEAALNHRPLPTASDLASKSKRTELEARQARSKTDRAEGSRQADRHQEAQESTEIQKGNPVLQLQYMQKLGNLISGVKPNVNEIFSVILDGMHQAVELQRVVMCLVTKDRRQLVPKFFRGEMSDAFKQGFNFRLDGENIFAHSLNQAQPFWMGSASTKGKAYLVTPEIRKHLGGDCFFVAPIIVSRKPIGLFYADSMQSADGLSEQQFVNFNSLAQQASIALAM